MVVLQKHIRYYFPYFLKWDFNHSIFNRIPNLHDRFTDTVNKSTGVLCSENDTLSCDAGTCCQGPGVSDALSIAAASYIVWLKATSSQKPPAKPHPPPRTNQTDAMDFKFKAHEQKRNLKFGLSRFWSLVCSASNKWRGRMRSGLYCPSFSF